MTKPFIPRREVMICCPNAPYWNDMTPDLKRRYFAPYWTEERIRRHVEMLKAFGFNAIQVTACGQVAVNSGVRQEVWKEKLVHFCRVAKDLDMGVAQFVWGSHFYDAAKNAYVGGLDWHDPADRKRMEQFFRDEAFLAPWVDRVVTHWLDPGGPKQGCNQCCLDTAVEIHNAILSAFRGLNPKVRGSFSNWFMGEPWWKAQWHGYEGVEALANHPALDRDSGITLGRQNYGMDGSYPPGPRERGAYIQASDLLAIRKAGRPAGVWSWYTTDIEIRPALHVHTDLIQNYFRAMPREAAEILDWVSVEDNCHGLNMQNLFIAGQLMRDPAQDAQALLEAFTRGLLGEKHGSSVAQALRAIEQVRCRSLRYTVEIGDPGLAPSGGEETRRLSPEWIRRNLTNVERALADLAPVAVAKNFQPAWPTTMSPADYLDELKAHLEAIRQMLDFLKGADEISRMPAGGESAQRRKAAIDALPQVIRDPAHTAGLEAAAYQGKMAVLRNVS